MKECKSKKKRKILGGKWKSKKKKKERENKPTKLKKHFNILYPHFSTEKKTIWKEEERRVGMDGKKREGGEVMRKIEREKRSG